MPTGGIRVLVVDDHEVVRAGITALLARQDGLRVVGEAGSAEEALRSAAARGADVVVLDYRLPGMDGARACEALLRRQPDTRVVIFTGFSAPEIVRACVAAGAHAYLTKEEDTPALPEAVRAVARGLGVFGSNVSSLVGGWARAAGTAGAQGAMDPAEVSLLSLLAEGLTNREIGARIHVSEHTVKVRLRRLMRKLGVARRSEAVAAAHDQGVI